MIFFFFLELYDHNKHKDTTINIHYDKQKKSNCKIQKYMSVKDYTRQLSRWNYFFFFFSRFVPLGKALPFLYFFCLRVFIFPCFLFLFCCATEFGRGVSRSYATICVFLLKTFMSEKISKKKKNFILRSVVYWKKENKRKKNTKHVFFDKNMNIFIYCFKLSFFMIFTTFKKYCLKKKKSFFIFFVQISFTNKKKIKHKIQKKKWKKK